MTDNIIEGNFGGCEVYHIQCPECLSTINRLSCSVPGNIEPHDAPYFIIVCAECSVPLPGVFGWIHDEEDY